MTTNIRKTILAAKEFEDKKSFEPRTKLELLNCPKVAFDAFFTLLFKPVKNPVLIAIYYYKYFRFQNCSLLDYLS